jgi:redox-sensitive bicupin YhaK (pirin superfamily)
VRASGRTSARSSASLQVEDEHFRAAPLRDGEGRLAIEAERIAGFEATSVHLGAAPHHVHPRLAARRERALDAARKTYVHAVRGEVEVNGRTLKGGDALLIENEPALDIGPARDAEVLVFDLH